MAKAAGITRSAYTFFENGTTDKLSLDAAIGIAKALDIPFYELFSIDESWIEKLKSENDKLKSEIDKLNEKIGTLEYQSRLVAELYSSSGTASGSFEMELERAKTILLLADMFQFVDFTEFKADYQVLVDRCKNKSGPSLELAVRFHLINPDTEAFSVLIDYIDFEAWSKSPDIMKLAGFILNANDWQKKSLVERLKPAKEFTDALEAADPDE